MSWIRGTALAVRIREKSPFGEQWMALFAAPPSHKEVFYHRKKVLVGARGRGAQFFEPSFYYALVHVRRPRIKQNRPELFYHHPCLVVHIVRQTLKECIEIFEILKLFGRFLAQDCQTIHDK